MKFKRLFESFIFEAKEEDVEEVRRELESLGYTLRPQKSKSDGQITVLCNSGEDRREVLNTIIKQLKSFDAEYADPNPKSSIGSAKLSKHVSVVVKNPPGSGRSESNTDMHELLQMFAGLIPNAKDLNGFIDGIEGGIKGVIDSSDAKLLIKDIEENRDSIERTWLDSYIKTGRVLREEVFVGNNINDYICFRTGGDKYTNSNPYKIRYGNIIHDLLVKTGRGGGKPDNINPADIIFVKNPDKVFGTMEEKLSLFDPENETAFYSDWKLMWYRLYEEGLFFPISLKKISGNGHAEKNNVIKPKEQEEIEDAALNLKLEKVVLNFNFDDFTSNFTVSKTTTNEKGENDVVGIVFQSRKQSGDFYVNIACDTHMEGQKAQLGKIKTAVNSLCPELGQNVAKRFGDKKNKLSKVTEEMIEDWRVRLESLLALQNSGYNVSFRAKKGLESVPEMFEYAIQGTEKEKGLFALYMQTIDYFYGVLCNNGDLNGKLARMVNIALKNTDDVSFFIKIS